MLSGNVHNAVLSEKLLIENESLWLQARAEVSISKDKIVLTQWSISYMRGQKFDVWKGGECRCGGFMASAFLFTKIFKAKLSATCDSKIFSFERSRPLHPSLWTQLFIFPLLTSSDLETRVDDDIQVFWRMHYERKTFTRVAIRHNPLSSVCVRWIKVQNFKVEKEVFAPSCQRRESINWRPRKKNFRVPDAVLNVGP